MVWNIFSFKTSDGLNLYGGLIEGKKQTKSVVVHVHGMTGFFYDGKLVETVARAANSAGHDFFAFNNRGMGSVSLIENRFLGTSMEKFEDSKEDISAALLELKKRGYSKFILSGHSTGCQKITYYAAMVKKLPIESLVLLAPADDVSVQKKNIGKNFQKYLEEAKELTEKNKGDTILPSRFETPMFSAQRYYHLFKENSVEGNIFNYTKPITPIAKINKPILAIFGEEEQYAVIHPKNMLENIAAAYFNKKSKTAIIPRADHSFHGEEAALYRVLRKFLISV